MNKRLSKTINIVYSNIQGFVGKKDSISEIIESLDCDVCLLAETMTTNVKIEGMKCITSKESIGQNVAMILRGKVNGLPALKLYEPNDTVDMMGIRLELAKNNYKRIYTAHMKQLSTNSRDSIRDQFFEIAHQFKQAALCKEGMILICDANVHIGREIPGCQDVQDWAGAEMLHMIREEGLHLLNSEKLCEGIVTRVDPRNGTKSTLDLAICNEFMIAEVQKMCIDETEMYRPTKYVGKKVTKTDHNSIIINIKVNKIASKLNESYLNTKCQEGAVIFKEEIDNAELDDIFINAENMDDDYGKLTKVWNETLKRSFKTVKRSKNRTVGVDSEIKELMLKEREVKGEWKVGVEKQEKLDQIREEISKKISVNLEKSTKEKIDNIAKSKCPQAEVFKIRKSIRKSESMDFPLKDMNGNVRVSKQGIDQVISDHFNKVFKQNPVARGWEEYWKTVDEIYQNISEKEKEIDLVEPPTFAEISSIVDNLDVKKSVQGDMSINLIKLAGESFKAIIYRCVNACFDSNQIPEEFRIEKMVLLYKQKGKLDEMDNYRGIFLRVIILTVYQKWLYMKAAPIVDKNGSKFAFGGRKGKSRMEALLIVKLIQDHARWTGEQIILKFLDVEKFFDSMNYKRCLIDLHASGVNGKYWKAYEEINKRKKCIPYVPSGPCSAIEVENVFVQGSTDAVLVAWNHMDTLNKKEKDVWSKNCSIQGTELDALTFVDDIMEIIKRQYDLILSSARVEVFQGETCLRFKPPKCKIIVMNKMEEIMDVIGQTLLEIVELHKYLGTLISSDGTRREEFKSKMKEANSVCNEIVQILKMTELSTIRLKYVTLLSNACVNSKVKDGCAVWDQLDENQRKIINDVKIKMMKRILEMPYSTPTSAIKYEMGVTDMYLEVEMERIMLMCEVMKKDGSVAKELLQTMQEKRVPGFCTDLEMALQLFGLDVNDEILSKDKKVIRETLKGKIVEMESKQLAVRMLEESKCDRLLLNGYMFDGRMKKYLVELPFEEARAVFMLRCRMFPTKDNFRGRWGTECTYCHSPETDMHIFACAGYSDLLKGTTFDIFMNLNTNMEALSVAAKCLLKVKERLELNNC